MKKPLRIFLADLVHDYRPNHFCTPLGIGFVAEHINQRFPGELDIRLFKSPEALLRASREEPRPDVIGLSNYSWNYEINRHLARIFRSEMPQVVLVQGGPHIRTDDHGIKQHLLDNPEIDYVAMFEGEWPTENLVKAFLQRNGPVRAQQIHTDIPGIAFLNGSDLVYSARPSRKGELEGLPSPYLSGRLDEFLDSPYYLPLLETNRGCPFACTFCAWGISVLNKVRRFDLERVCAEIDYVASRSEATHWYFTDANFGMFPRDIEIAEAIRKAAERSPYFQRLSINWAKNSSKYCVEIQKILKGICDPLVAVQTTDADVLVDIKRANIKMDTMTDLVAQGQQDGIAMTTDVLAGLPGETLESHFRTLRDVFSIGFQSFNVGQIRMLPGAEMETDADRERFGIQTAYRLIAGFYGIYDGAAVCEYEESVVATNTMSRDDMFTLRKVHFLAWALWNSGLAQPLLRFLHADEGINPLDAILALYEEQLSPRVQTFLDEYIAEAREEWYPSAENLMEHFRTNTDELLHNEYLKLNLKYLARLLLDKELARDVLQVVAGRSQSPVALELAEFSLERTIFIEERVLTKQVIFSESLVNALVLIYPALRLHETTECTFSITDKQLRAIGLELERFHFDEMPIRAVALALQNYGDKLFYDFSFGEHVESAKPEQFFDSFDYADQLKTYSAKA